MEGPEGENKITQESAAPETISPEIQAEIAQPISETRIAINQTSTIDRLQDPHYLPSRKEVIDAFKAAGGYSWINFQMENKNMHEILTIEYINAITDYLIVRLGTIEGEGKQLTVLELGAGDGRLSHLIRMNLEEKGYDEDVINIVASDERASSEGQQVFPVELIRNRVTPFSRKGGMNSTQGNGTEFNRQMLEKYQPTIVISSWPPQGIDFTADIRSTNSVDEYLIIGPEEAVGDDWQTLGLEFASPDPGNPKLLPPYEEDGWRKTDIQELSDLQLTRADDFPGKGISGNGPKGIRIKDPII